MTSLDQYNRTIAELVVKRYAAYYDNEINGCAILIAEEVAKKTGGTMTAGYVEYNGGTNRRNHIWVEHNGIILDPMLQYMFSKKDGPRHVKVHQDARIMEELMGRYDMYYVVDSNHKTPESNPVSECLSYLVDKFLHNDFHLIDDKYVSLKIAECTCGDVYGVLMSDFIQIRAVLRQNKNIIGQAIWDLKKKEFLPLQDKNSNIHKKEIESFISSYLFASQMLQ